MKMAGEKLFHNSNKREEEKMWAKWKKKKSFSFLMLLSNGVVDTWYGKKSVDDKKWIVEKIDKEYKRSRQIRFAAIKRLTLEFKWEKCIDY